MAWESLKGRTGSTLAELNRAFLGEVQHCRDAWLWLSLKAPGRSQGCDASIPAHL